jgi:thiamine monophosphate kinase
VVKGIVEGCKQSDCILLGGETAEMPGFYSPGEYDLAGFAVGNVKKDKVIDGSRIQVGDTVQARTVLGAAWCCQQAHRWQHLARPQCGRMPEGASTPETGQQGLTSIHPPARPQPAAWRHWEETLAAVTSVGRWLCCAVLCCAVLCCAAAGG